MTRACVLLADGFEEIEAVTIIDVLRRSGVDVEVLGVDTKTPRGSHEIGVRADALLSQRERDDFDLVVLPGGMPGARVLRDHDGVQRFVKRQREQRRTLGAICAAPIALARAGVLEGRRATCYPGFEDQLAGARHTSERVVDDDGVVTSRGPGTAMDFSLYLVEKLMGAQAAAQLRERMLVG